MRIDPRLAVLPPCLVLLLALVGVLCLFASPGHAQTLPTLPQVTVDTTMPAITGNTYTVNAGEDLQAAINTAAAANANLNHLIVVQAEATFTGPFTLPARAAGTGWIVLQSSALGSLPSAGTRVAPSDALSMPTIVGSAGGSTFQTANMSGSNIAHHYWFAGLAITPRSGAYSDDAAITIGNDESASADLPHHFVIDRCYLYGDSTYGAHNGLVGNGNTIAVVDSYLTTFNSTGYETHAIVAYNSLGPFKIDNNYLSASAIGVLFGGAAPSLPDPAVPSDITITRNYFFKPLTWYAEDPSYAGTKWVVKNHLEFKNAQRGLIEGNIFENNWVGQGDQNGYSILFTPRGEDGHHGSNTAADMTFRLNIIRRSYQVSQIFGEDDGSPPSQPAQRILFENNVFDKIDSAMSGGQGYGQGGIWMVSSPGYAIIQDLTLRHNTFLLIGTGQNSYGFLGEVQPAVNNFVLQDSICSNGIYGFAGSGTSDGLETLNNYITNYTFTKNAIIGGTAGNYTGLGNFFPADTTAVTFVDYAGGDYHLASDSPYKNAGTDGKDLGADIDAITAATAGVIEGINDTTAPSISITTPTSALSYTTNSSPLTVGGTSTDSVGVTAVTWVNDRGGSGTASGTTSWAASGIVLEAGTNVLTVSARDAAGNLGTATLTVTYDATAPTAPSSLSATAASSSQIDLSWTAATDTVGVTGYRVERCQGAGCSSFSQVATPTGTSSSDTGLQAGTSYSYRVRATDAAGNLSGYSNTASATTPTAPAPTSGPASLTVRTLAGAKIYLGGNPAHLGDLKGTVPDNGELSIQGLRAKKYVIRATLQGFLDAYRQVSLDPGANVVSLEMAPFNSSDTLRPTLTTLKAGGTAIRGGGQHSAPFVVDWDNDGKKDLLVGGGDGAVVLYQNVGSDAAPQFGASQAVMADNAPISVLGPASVFVVDWDSDGNKDLLVGDGQGQVRWYRNTGTDDTPILTAWGPLLAGSVEIEVTGPAAPVVVDWNSDGPKDLLVGDGAGRVWHFLNQGTDAAPVLATGVSIALPDVGVARTNARPFVVDWNEDGRKDLLVGDANGRTYLFLNTGTDAAPAFASGAALTGQGGPIVVSSNAAPFAVDWDNNSLRDLVIGTNDGEVFLAPGTEPPAPSSSGDGGSGGGCFIATAAYGSPLAPQVQLLRKVRDRHLLRYAVGRVFVALYYRLSPPLAEVIAGSETLRALVRMGLVPVLWWAALVLWSPALGLAVLVAGLSLGAWSIRWLTHLIRNFETAKTPRSPIFPGKSATGQPVAIGRLRTPDCPVAELPPFGVLGTRERPVSMAADNLRLGRPDPREP